MKHFDLVIVGNGIIGTLAAALLPDDISIALVGPTDRMACASTAAGAMINVFGEIDYALDDYTRRKLAIGVAAIPRWLELLEGTRVVVAEKTIVYKQQDATYLESKCFNAIVEASKPDFESPEIDLLKRTMRIKADFLQLQNEPAVSSQRLFRWLDARVDARPNVKIYRRAGRVEGNTVRMHDAAITFDKLLCCAGSFTTKALGEFGQQLLPLYFGLGTSMELGGASITLPDRTVVRTPNRGSTCGIHMVPRENGHVFLGAGSLVLHHPVWGHKVDVEIPGHIEKWILGFLRHVRSLTGHIRRMNTVHYLLDSVEADFGGVKNATVSPAMGYRPIAFDGQPMLGPLKSNPNIYVATGTKRDGLTYAPLIIDDIQQWAANRGRTGLFDGWEPDRAPVSYGPRQHAIESYVENKLAGLLEHDRVDANSMDRVKRELAAEAEMFYGRICKRLNLPPDFGIHPEVLNTFTLPFGLEYVRRRWSRLTSTQ